MDKENVVYIKKNEIMLFAGKWTEMETVILSSIDQSYKDKYHTFTSYAESRLKKT
jgi:hypothetical protein